MLPQSFINRMVHGTTEAMDGLLFRIIMGCTFVLENVFTSNEHRAIIGAQAQRRIGERNLVCNCPVKNFGYHRENQVQKKCTNYPIADKRCKKKDNNPMEDNRCPNRDDWIECDVNCHPNCCNRPYVANQMMKERFRIEHYQGRGLGLKSLVSIERGQFVIEYTGLVRYMEEQYEEENADELNYAFRIADTPLLVDGKNIGNHARYINHSCCPNLKAYSYVTQGTIKILMEAIKPIPAGQELTLDYSDVIKGYRCNCAANNCKFISPEKKAKEDVAYKNYRKQEKAEKRNKRLFGSDVTNSGCAPVTRRTRGNGTDTEPQTSCSETSARRRELSQDPCDCLSDRNPRPGSKRLSNPTADIRDPTDPCRQLNPCEEVYPSTSAACREELERARQQTTPSNNDGEVPSTSAACREEYNRQGMVQVDIDEDKENQAGAEDDRNFLFIDIVATTPSAPQIVPGKPGRQNETPGAATPRSGIADRALRPVRDNCLEPQDAHLRHGRRTSLRRSLQLPPNHCKTAFSNVSMELDFDLTNRPDLSPNELLRNILLPPTPRRIVNNRIEGSKSPTLPVGNRIHVCPGRGDNGPLIPSLEEPHQQAEGHNYDNGTPPPTSGLAPGTTPPTTPGRRSVVQQVTPSGQPPFPANLTIVAQQGPPGTPGRLSVSYNTQIPTQPANNKKQTRQPPPPCEPQPGCSSIIFPDPHEGAYRRPPSKRKIIKKKICHICPNEPQPSPRVIINLAPPSPRATTTTTNTIASDPPPQRALRLRLRVPRPIVEVIDNEEDPDYVPYPPRRTRPRQKRQREEYPQDNCESPQPGPSRRMRMDPEVDNERFPRARTRRMLQDLEDADDDDRMDDDDNDL